MAFPTSDVDTQHLDASTDSPAAARGSLLDLVQKFNALRAFFNSFWLGLLATTSAATARTGLGATTVGSAVFTAANQTEARTAIGAIDTGLGITQQWYIYSSGYSINTNYINTSGAPIVVVVNCIFNTGSDGLIKVDEIVCSTHFIPSVGINGWATVLTAIVPNNSSFRIESNTGVLTLGYVAILK